MTKLELAANAFNALAILLAGLNSIHTWWTGIIGCLLFGCLFYANQLYADVTLQAFFIGTSIVGWHHWKASGSRPPLSVRRTTLSAFASMSGAAAVVAAAYGWLLHRFTDAYAPFLDSVILAFSVLGQLLLMRRRYENWWCWLLVNTVAVPLYLSRGLTITAVLYACFWINAVVALFRWRKFLQA
jgi:nicotinamide mononucleotide transporter